MEEPCGRCDGSGRITQAEKDEHFAEYVCVVLSVPEGNYDLAVGDIVQVPLGDMVIGWTKWRPKLFTENRHRFDRAVGDPRADIRVWCGDGFVPLRNKVGIAFVDMAKIHSKSGSAERITPPGEALDIRVETPPHSILEVRKGLCMVYVEPEPEEHALESGIVVPGTDAELAEQRKMFSHEQTVVRGRLLGSVVKTGIDGVAEGDWVLTRGSGISYETNTGGRFEFCGPEDILAKVSFHADA